MTDKDETMQQAFDLIERLNQHGWILADFEDEVYATLDSLKAALEQPVQEPVGNEWTPCMKLPVVVHVRQQRPGESHVSTREGITPVKPDDLIMRGVSGEEYPIGRAIFEQTYSLDIAPPLPVQPEQEPVAWMCNDFDGDTCELTNHDECENPIPLYTAPPQRQPLTDEQIKVIHFNLCNTVGSDYKTVARAIEAAHGIKEQP